MTEVEFLDKLKEVAPQFKWTHDMMIRASRTVDGKRWEFCPITAVAFGLMYNLYKTNRYELAADNIGLAPDVGHEIIRASDGWHYVTVEDDSPNNSVIEHRIMLRQAILNSIELPEED